MHHKHSEQSDRKLDEAGPLARQPRKLEFGAHPLVKGIQLTRIPQLLFQTSEEHLSDPWSSRIKEKISDLLRQTDALSFR